jgi:excisionase family DNA binding protein
MNHDALAYRIPDAGRITGLGNTKLYELIGQGVLDARKAGSRTLITAESLNRYIASLPKANITTGRQAA